MTMTSGEIKLSKKAIYDVERQSASPSGGQEVSVNPPPLLWPRTVGKGVHYDVRLAQDPAFHKGTIIASSGLPWAMFNPHKKLAGGTWHWEYAVSGAGAPAWSKPNAFIITDTTRVFESPTAKEMLAACPRSHPRVLLKADHLEAFRKRVRNLDAAVSVVNAAKKQLGTRLPTEQDGLPKRPGENEWQSEKLASDASKSLGQRMYNVISQLSMAYLITADEQFAREAVRWAREVAKWDRARVSGKNNLGDRYCLKAMVLAYDSGYAILSEAEKQQLLRGIRARAGHFFDSWINRLEARVTSEHTWQHILYGATQAAVATLSELPESEQWLTYAYEVWLGRAPTEGRSDGGWTVGVTYLGFEAESLVGIPILFQNLTGVDFFQAAFYHNSLYYLLYALPPHCFSDGFGDAHEKGKGPRPSHIRYAQALGDQLGDPYAFWYVRKSLEGTDKERVGWRDWSGLAWGKERKSPPLSRPFALPQARAFRETGVVAMHTDLADTTNDLFVSFRSSPWGSLGHAHADQNTFNIVVGGERLFYSSGYKVSGRDDHVLGWYKHTRGHNGILIDGKGQPYGTEAYGWIPRFLHGERITYCVGDASQAYDTEAAAKEEEGVSHKEPEFIITSGRAGLTRFRRHVALFRPSTVVVYDELSADHDAEWSWLLHSMGPIRLEPDPHRLFASAANARSRVDLFGSVPLKLEVTNHFAVPAINWRGTTEHDEEVNYPDNQWHFTATSSRKTPNMRFLAIIQISREWDSSVFTEAAPDENGWVRVAGWQIRAELDAPKKPFLEAQSVDSTAAFATGRARITMGGKEYAPKLLGSALLIENTGDKRIVQEAVDELPKAAR
jgi:uncharacterized protein DUF4962/heparinase II/III-like protein